MKKYILAICLMAIVLFTFSACSRNELDLEQIEQPVQEFMGGIFHQFDNLGFSIKFPAFWEGKYGIAEVDNFEPDLRLVAIYHLGSAEFGGVLLRLGRAVGEHFTYDNPPLMAGGSILLKQTGGYTYFINFPSDVQHDGPNSESGIEYLEMVGYWEPRHWDFLVNSFRLIE